MSDKAYKGRTLTARQNDRGWEVQIDRRDRTMTFANRSDAVNQAKMIIDQYREPPPEGRISERASYS